MNYFIYLFLFVISPMFAQKNIETMYIGKTEIKADSVIDVTNFNTQFLIKNNVFIKETRKTVLKYSNIQLGNITSANTFNPLKINLFYKAFNTAIILDNRLTEIFKIDFSTLKDYKNISHISTGSDNTIWVFNQDLQQLELFDYRANKTRIKTLPITSNILGITSNYNACWLLTKDFIYKYNYTGSLLSKTKNTGYTAIKESDQNIILKKKNALFWLPKKTKGFKKLNIPNLLISQFFVTNEIVYIYSDGFLHQYQLKLK